MSDFSVDWLRLRASADLAARDPSLARNFAAALPRGHARIIDLASGSGANARALLPRIAGDQQWTLVDRDRDLLAAQSEEFTAWARRQGYPITAGGGGIAIAAQPAQWRLTAMPIDLASDLASLGEIDADGITTAAFFDLVSAEWLERFVALIAKRRLPLLAVLTVDGRREWQPALDQDAAIAAAFARHQTSNKGFGPALGGGAPALLDELLRANGYTIDRAASDWQIGPSDRRATRRPHRGRSDGRAQSSARDRAAIDAWEKRRREHRAAGQLRLTIGHCDVLALPA